MEPIRHSCGFTLIELLVTLLIISVTIGMVLPSTRVTERDLLIQETNRLTQVMTYAHNESIGSGKMIAWEPTQSGYHFLEYDQLAQVWKPSLDNLILRERMLPKEIFIDLINQQNRSNNRILFSPSGLNAPFSIGLKNQYAQASIQGNLIGQITTNISSK